MSESERAIMEAARFAAMEAYFDARPQIMVTTKLERIFEAGFDAAYQEVERLRAELAAREWRTIESAPRDGTHILLCAPGRVTYGYWLVLEHGELIGDCGGVCRCPDYDEPPEPFWYSEDGGFTDEHPPTHWIPLPPEPKP